MAGQQAGQAKIEELGKAGGGGEGGWISAMHMFDYNLDRRPHPGAPHRRRRLGSAAGPPTSWSARFPANSQVALGLV